MERKSVDNYKTGFSESSSSRPTGSRESERKNASPEKRKSDQDGDGNHGKKKSKISFGFIKPLSTPAPTAAVKAAAISKETKPLSMQIAQPKKTDSPKVKLAFNKAFNTDEDDEEDEMPPEARMRMRNIGRETPTSCGPNSFGKTKQGFCDARSGGPSSKLPKTSK